MKERDKTFAPLIDLLAWYYINGWEKDEEKNEDNIPINLPTVDTFKGGVVSIITMFDRESRERGERL